MNPNWQAERITQSSLKLSNTSTFQTALKLQAPTSVMATLVRIAFSGSFYNNVDMLASHSLYKGGECSRSRGCRQTEAMVSLLLIWQNNTASGAAHPRGLQLLLYPPINNIPKPCSRLILLV